VSSMSQLVGRRVEEIVPVVPLAEPCGRGDSAVTVLIRHLLIVPNA